MAQIECPTMNGNCVKESVVYQTTASTEGPRNFDFRDPKFRNFAFQQPRNLECRNSKFPVADSKL